MEGLALLTKNDIQEIAREAARVCAEQMIAELKKPRPSSVNQSEAAEMLDVSPPTVNRLIKAGKLRLNGVGRIPIEAIDRLIR